MRYIYHNGIIPEGELMSSKKRKKDRRNLIIRGCVSVGLILSSLALFANAVYILLVGAPVMDILLRAVIVMIIMFLAGNIASPVLQKFKEDKIGLQKTNGKNPAKKVA